jgi:hypothetical protein
MQDAIRFMRDNWGSKMDRAPHMTVALNQRALLAVQLVERWGMVAGAPDGEDSAGRQRLRMMSPDEMVVRATATANQLFWAFGDCGWMYEVPEIKDESEGDTSAVAIERDELKRDVAILMESLATVGAELESLRGES